MMRHFCFQTHLVVCAKAEVFYKEPDAKVFYKEPDVTFKPAILFLFNKLKF